MLAMIDDVMMLVMYVLMQPPVIGLLPLLLCLSFLISRSEQASVNCGIQPSKLEPIHLVGQRAHFGT